MVMNNETFCDTLWDIAEEYNTVYMKGVFGSPVTEGLISAKAKQYPKWYTGEKQKFLRTLIGKNYFGFDCVCLVKGIVWGWEGRSDKIYGGAVYRSNGLEDLTVEGMQSICGVTKNFNSLQKGELLFMPGHVGVYLGGGLACECTPIWENGVQITGVKNVGAPAGYNSRTWVSHGKLPYIAYEESDILGDIDGDGEVTANDYNMARNAVLGKITLTQAQIKRGDINGNGRIDARDYLLIRRIYLGTYF